MHATFLDFATVSSGDLDTALLERLLPGLVFHGQTRAAGVAVCNLRDYCTPSVVQHVFAMLLALTHRLHDYGQLVRTGGWEKAGQFSIFPYPIRELRGRQFGIVGLGTLGRSVAQLAGAFGMQVLVVRRPGGPPAAGRIDLDELLPRLDVLSLHCPLTDATCGALVDTGSGSKRGRNPILSKNRVASPFSYGHKYNN